MKKLLILFFLLLLCGCYTQPVLVTKNVAGTKKLKDIAIQLKPSSVPIDVKPDEDLIIVEPLDKSVPWQLLKYKSKKIQVLVRDIISFGGSPASTCQTNVKVLNLAHEAIPVGMGFDVVRLEGSFYITNTCLSINCEIYADYSTEYYFVTQSADNRHYSEAIVGVILKAVVAAQSCPSSTGY